MQAFGIGLILGMPSALPCPSVQGLTYDDDEIPLPRVYV